MKPLNKYALLQTARPPAVYKWVLHDALYRMETNQKTVYLTFDDGPTPGVSDLALDLLKTYQAKASFFCLGKNVEAFPELFQRMLNEGHSVGNHSYSHPDGWKTPNKDYFHDVAQAEKVINSGLFRPPYGKLSPFQYLQLKKRFRVVLWDTLSLDYDQNLEPEFCWDIVRKNTRNGSIVVFHDSLKAAPRMLPVLEKTLNWLSKEGYRMQAIPMK
ncbi:MAG: polysaccharide deacetylase family protein [Bacteroidia bacterium]|nr:polysaccharide deacetylase family protein [Bacteroidia bacterium]